MHYASTVNTIQSVNTKHGMYIYLIMMYEMQSIIPFIKKWNNITITTFTNTNSNNSNIKTCSKL